MQLNKTQARLVTIDFDKTLAQTFEACPGGVGVELAYDMALRELFGESELLGAVGGLKNRAPTELVRDILSTHNGLRRYAWQSYERKCEKLRDLLKKGLGLPLVPISDSNEADVLGEMLVRLKLQILESQIGPEWPKPCDGALDGLERFASKNIPIAIVSSGHEGFIQRCFSVWGALCPQILITDDFMRGQPISPEKKIKPSPVLIHYAMMRAYQLGYRALVRSETVHVGDDYAKDGSLARNACIAFWWYASEGQPHDVQLQEDDVIFTHWREIGDRIESL